MCGIAGLFQTQGIVEKNVICDMTDSVRHRGPDGSGVRMFPNGGIGNRRLSIIDLETGAQPLSNEDGTIWITFNGEIYNFRELYSELKSAGHSFRTTSDTEVIVHAYEEWGTSCLKRLRGMFAFGIVDTRKRKLILARDHFGIKPLYYLSMENRFAFASELRQFSHIPDCSLTLDLESIDQYLWLKYIPAPRTVFKNVYKLHPAHFLIYSFDGKLEESQEYWNVDFSRKKIKSEREWLEELDAVLRKSVEAHLVSDVPVGAFLSGGLDSTLIVGYMSELLKEPVKTFSIGFEEESFNELPYSAQAAKRYQTDHRFEIVKPRALEALPDLVRHYGEPFGDSSCIPTYYLCKLARQDVTVALSGDGGDECFVGYHTYSKWMESNKVKDWKHKVYPLLEKLTPFRYPRTDRLDDWIIQKHEVSPEWRASLWKKEFLFAYRKNSDVFDRILRDAERLSLANKVQYLDLKTYLPHDILAKVDTASMMNSLEVRTPFVDKEVWEFAAAIPEEFNVNDHQVPGQFQGKLLLKKLLSRSFDEAFIGRRKKGFSIPLEYWFSDSGDWRGIVIDRLLSGDSKVMEYFDKGIVESLIRRNRWSALWNLLFLEEWLRNFTRKEGEPLTGKIAELTGDALSLEKQLWERVLADVNDRTGAFTEWLEYVESRKASRSLLSRASRALMKAKFYPQALKTADKGSHNFPDDAGFCLIQGRACFFLDRFPEALSFLDKFSSISKHNSESLRLKSRILLRMNRLDEAGNTVSAALKIDPGNQEGLSLRARIDEARQGTSGPSRVFARWWPVWERNPTNAPALDHLIDAVSRDTDQKASEAALSQLLSKVSSDQSGIKSYIEGRMAFARGDFDSAVIQFQKGGREGYTHSLLWEIKALNSNGLLAESATLATEHAQHESNLALKAQILRAGGMEEQSYEALEMAIEEPGISDARQVLIRMAYIDGHWGLAYSHMLEGSQSLPNLTEIRKRIEAGFRTAGLEVPVHPLAARSTGFHSTQAAVSGIVSRILKRNDPPDVSRSNSARVVMVVSSLGVSGGGAERQCVQLSNGLAKIAQRQIAGVHILCPNLGGKFFYRQMVDPAVTVEEFSTNGETLTAANIPALQPFADLLELIQPVQRKQWMLQLAHKLYEIQPQVVHAWLDQPVIDASLVACMLNIPVVAGRWGSMPPGQGQQMNPGQLDLLRTGYDEIRRLPWLRFSSNSRLTGNAYADYMKISPDQIHLLPNGVDGIEFFRDPEGAARLRDHLGIPDNARVVGVVFRYNEVKRPFLWVDAARLLAERNPDMHFVMIGDGALKSSVSEHARSLGIQHLHMVGEQKDLSAWYSMMDLLMLTSRAEGVSNVVVEAQWIGVPVVVPDVGGLSEALLNDRTGLLLREPEARDFADAVCRIFENPERYAEMCREAKRFAREKFSTETLVSAALKLYGIA